MSENARHSLLVALIPLLVAVVSFTGALRHARDSLSDLLFGRRDVPKNITIIAIDEDSIHSIGQWPWPRSVMAQAIARLPRARAIGIDVNYKEPSRLGPGDDKKFADAMRSGSAPVVLASEMQPNGAVSNPIPVLASASVQGLANVSVDSDGVLRTANISRNGIPSFAAQLAHVGGFEVSAPETGRLNFAGPDQTFPSYPFTELIAGRVPETAIAGHIVLIGATARDLQDYRQTPMGLMSGVEVQANILENILSNNFLRSGPLIDALLTLMAGLLGCLLAYHLHRVWIIIPSLIVLLAVVWVGVFLAFNSGLLLDLLMPTLAVLAGAGATIVARWTATSRERRFIHDTFSRYLAPQVIEVLLRDPSRVRLGGEKRELTILFSDIRGFTSLSETMGPQELANFLNRYLDAMTNIILDNRGVIDKFIGDAIMAFWGAPLDDEQHALNGIRSALAMVNGLDAFNVASQKEGLPRIDVGIGLNTGAVTVGNMGSEKRFDYTVIGDDVNLASRLEGLTKMYGVTIIVSESVLLHLAPDARSEVHTREIDRVRVKGKSKSVTIFEVMVPSKNARLSGYLEMFATAREQYYAGQWDQAIIAVDEFLTAVGHDGPAQLLKERALSFQKENPAGWQGVYEMTHK